MSVRNHRGEIALSRIEETVIELYLAATEKKVDSLWKRVEKAMTALKVSPKEAQRILDQRQPEALAKSVRSWITEARKSGK